MPNFVRNTSSDNIESPQPVYQFVDTAISGSPDIVKGIPGQLFSVQVDARLSAVPVFIQIFNNVAPTVGTTAADEIILCPPYIITTTSYISNAVLGKMLGKTFSNAITVAATNILTGAVGPSANVAVTILYQ